MRSQQTVPLAWSFALSLTFLFCYALLAPSVPGDKDGSEFVLVLSFGGLAHPTGYPLYTLAGHGFVSALHALGVGWEYASNLFSALGGAAAIFLFHAFAIRLTSPLALSRAARFLLALLPALLFGLNPVWTYETTLAEVYSWHLAWVGGACLYFEYLAGSLAAKDYRWSARRTLGHAILWGLLCGIGGAHHVTALFVAAPLSLCLFIIGRGGRGQHRLGARHAAAVALGALLALSSYLFVTWRVFHPAQWGWPAPPSWTGAWSHITASAYKGYFGSFAPSDFQRHLLSTFIYPFLLGGAILLLLGIILDRRRRSVLLALGCAMSATLIHAFGYGVPDPASYFLAPLAMGLFGATAIAARWISTATRPRAILAGITCGLLSLFGATGWTRLALERKEELTQFDRKVRSMWDDITLERAFVLWPSDMHTRLVALQLLEHSKPGLEVLSPTLFSNEWVRSHFQKEHGISLKIDKPDTSSFDAFARELNRNTPLPVIQFDPEKSSVRLLRK